jgi:hypothetical protein
MRSATACLVLFLFLAACGDDSSPADPRDGGPVRPRDDGGSSGEDAMRPRVDAGPRPDAGPPGPGPLMDLPSAEGPHVAMIRELGDDEWLALPAPAGDPTYGTAPGRSWGGKAFAWAPDLGGAFLYGEGPHAHIYRDGLANDELWVYDAMANRWITVHPGTDTTTFSARVASGDLRLNDDLQLVDETDEPQPVHVLIHAWSFLAYDTDRRAFTFFAGRGLGTYYLPGWNEGSGPMAEGIAMLEDAAAGRSEPLMSPWSYEVTTGRFARSRATGTGPGDPFADFPQFHYVSSMRKLFLGGRNGVAYYDPETATWSVASDSGPRPTGYDHGGCYDPTRNRIYLGGGSDEARSGLYTYDIASDAWSEPESGGPSSFGTNSATVNYDVASDAVTIISHADRAVYVYDLASTSWSMLPFPSSVEFSQFASMMGVYSPDLNAYFLYFAIDGEPDGEMWAYRYRR